MVEIELQAMEFPRQGHLLLDRVDRRVLEDQPEVIGQVGENLASWSADEENVPVLL
jgi:hypothetical protein